MNLLTITRPDDWHVHLRDDAMLAAVLPDLRTRLEALVPRLFDLAAVVRANFYHPDFDGSFSIKAVLPALCPDMTYKNLMIQDGAAAMAAYAELRDRATTPERRAALSEGLKVYCGQDTEAMVRILAHLYDVVGAPAGA